MTIEELKKDYAEAHAEQVKLQRDVDFVDAIYKAEIEEITKERFNAHLERNAALIDALEAADKRLKQTRDALTAECLRLNAETGSATVAPGCVVKTAEKPKVGSLDEAIKWGFDQFSNGNGKFISFNEKEFAKDGVALIRAGVAPFAQIEESKACAFTVAKFGIVGLTERDKSLDLDA